MSNQSKGAARTGRVPKLRLSCDACAAAKVKCSRDQPQCERCTANGTQCVYGQSRRSGKPPRDPNRQSVSGNDTKKGSTGARSNQDDGMFPVVHNDPQQQIDLNHFQGGPWLPGSFSAFDDGSMRNGYDTAFAPGSVGSPMASIDDSMFAQDAVSSCPTTSGYSTASSQSPSWHFDASGSFSGTLPSSLMFPAMDFQDLGHPLSNVHSGSSSAATSSAGLSTEANVFNGHPQAPQHQGSCGGRDCYNLAYSTLASLHFQQPFGSPPHERHSSVSSSASSGSQAHAGVPSLDSVLNNNKAAIQNVLQLLSCPCAADAHMALLYASITSKILIWYQVAAGTTISSSSPAAIVEHSSITPNPEALGVASGNAMNTPYSMGSTFADEPVKIGTFSADEEYQAPMRQVLLLGELRKAGVLIDALSRMHATNDGSNEKDQKGITASGQARNLYATLGQWLKAELARTMNEVKNGSRMQLEL